MSDKSICQVADELVNSDRRGTYGHPLKNFTDTANILNALGFSFNSQKLRPEDVGLLMIGVKLARQLHKNNKDTLTDICGYAKCIDVIHSFYEETKPQASIA